MIFGISIGTIEYNLMNIDVGFKLDVLNFQLLDDFVFRSRFHITVRYGIEVLESKQ